MINEIAILDQAGIKALTTAIGVLGPRLVAAAMKPRGRRAEDLSIARWFETYQITTRFPELEGISDEATERLAEVLGGDEIQAALHELLAVRLTDGSDADAGRACEVFRLTLSSADPSLSPFAPPLAEFYDDQICDMVGRLEAAEPSMLAQIRSEAMSARMIAIMRAIERHTAALTARPNARSEASFLASYRSHVIDQHGKLEPPDFDRRRRVPIADIYVPAVIYEEISPERTVALAPNAPPTLSVRELADRLDRIVLLGDPGGGKTTASNVLMHHFASNQGRVPFLVTLRNYAAADSPERSVAGFIENQLETYYQCPAPAGLVDMLLLTGRAVVIFDGLDELLDTTRRADVASRVEHFCREYPLAPVMVTSRVVGYDQARLDETQFVSYRLGGFRDEDAAEYARKWFALEEGARGDEADAFLAESESVPDLRTNPLLLSLMCILYRGEGSLPRNRAEVYEQCANLLFRRWDARRHIHQDLRAGHLLEATLRHLAWWLFTRDNTQTAVTERELVTATTEFLYGRGFESEDDARVAAREFIDFCRGRMWVFTEAGTTATGEKLYAFTHRTFLEYFAASQLAFDSDTPEKMARTLAPHVARGEWEVIGELAVQIKDTTSRDGSRRIYETLLDDRRYRSDESRSNILQFLARGLRSTNPSPRATRRLTKEILGFLFSGDLDSENSSLPLSWLMASCDTSIAIVDEEIAASIAQMVASGDPDKRLASLRLSFALRLAVTAANSDRAPRLLEGARMDRHWQRRSEDLSRTYRSEIIELATDDETLLTEALFDEFITVEGALEKGGGLLPLLRLQDAGAFGAKWVPYLSASFLSVTSGNGHDHQRATLRALGSHLSKHPTTPWIKGEIYPLSRFGDPSPSSSLRAGEPLEPLTYLGGAAIALISAEADPEFPPHFVGTALDAGTFLDLNSYIDQRYTLGSTIELPDLPVPEEFKQIFRDWAERKVNFTAPAPDSRDRSAS